MKRNEMIKQNLVGSSTDKHSNVTQVTNYLYFRRATLILFLLLIITGLGVMYACHLNRIEGNNHSTIRLFNQGQTLYFTGKDNKLYSYDAISKDISMVINEPVFNFYANDKYYFFSSETGFYYQNIAAREKYRIADSAFEIIEHQDAIYFVEYKAEEIFNSLNKRNVIGQKKWVTLYRFNITDRTLTDIKSDYHHDDYLTDKIKDISITDVNLINDRLYYRNASDIHCLSLDGAQDSIIYQSDGTICRLDWYSDKFYYIESIEWSPTDPVEVEKDVGLFLNIISLNQDEISSYLLPDDNYDIFEEMVFDPKLNVYWSMLEDQLITFSPVNPAEYTTVAKIDRTIERNKFDLIMVGSSIYIAVYDGIATHNNTDFSIMTVNDQNDVITVIENGKAVR